MEGDVLISWTLCVLLVIARTPGVLNFDDHRSVCSQNVFKATCDKAQYIYILRAWYGRRKGICVEHLHNEQECGCDVTSSLRHLCDGRNSCNKDVLDKYLPCKSTCSFDLAHHLYVNFGCVGQWSKERHLVACNQEQFKAECHGGQYVYIRDAWLGRRGNRCVESVKEDCGCDVTSDVEKTCANVTQCSKDVLRKNFACNHDNSTCSSSLRQHLHVTYACRGALLRITPHASVDDNSTFQVQGWENTNVSAVSLEPSGADNETLGPISGQASTASTRSNGIIIGCVVGIIVAILVAAVAVVYYCYRKKHQPKAYGRSPHEREYKTVPGEVT